LDAIWILRGFAASDFGTVTVSTPFSNFASIFDASTYCGKRSVRLNEPGERSTKKTRSTH